MLSNNQVPYKVLLPAWIFEQAEDDEHLKSLVHNYMNSRYPDYSIKKIKDRFAICERK